MEAKYRLICLAFNVSTANKHCQSYEALFFSIYKMKCKHESSQWITFSILFGMFWADFFLEWKINTFYKHTSFRIF